MQGSLCWLGKRGWESDGWTERTDGPVRGMAGVINLNIVRSLVYPRRWGLMEIFVSRTYLFLHSFHSVFRGLEKRWVNLGYSFCQQPLQMNTFPVQKDKSACCNPDFIISQLWQTWTIVHYRSDSTLGPFSTYHPALDPLQPVGDFPTLILNSGYKPSCAALKKWLLPCDKVDLCRICYR